MLSGGGGARKIGSTASPLSMLSVVALAVINQDVWSSIEAYESRKSHGKIGDCEQCSFYERCRVFVC